MKRWYAVQCQPRRELYAEQQLKNQGFATFIPLHSRGRKVGSRLQRALVPFFPNYLFVELDIETQRWRSINGTLGVARLVSFGERSAVCPAPLPIGLVERFRELSDEQGVLRFEERLQPGDRARLIGGPFDNLCGILESAGHGERVILLLDILSKATRVSVDRASLLAVDPSHSLPDPGA